MASDLARPALFTVSGQIWGYQVETALQSSDKVVRNSLPMKGSEFVRKVHALARQRGLDCRLDEKRGKGSHMTLYFGDRLTIVRNLKDELKTGTLHAMCRQLGLRREEL